MQTPPWIPMLLRDRLVRTAFALLVASGWYVVSVAGDIGWSGWIFVSAAPAALSLLWWRTRPLLALGLTAVTLVLVVWGAWNGISAGGGSIIACSAAWFAILGCARSGRQGPTYLACGFVALVAVACLFNSGAPSAFAALFAGATAYVFGWGWRQLFGRLTDTTRRGDAAERDVLIELERNRIAREVHDVVAHSLAVVIAQADGARFAAETRPETVAPALEAISDTARRALGEVRTMLHDLRTSGDGTAPGAEDLDALVESVRELGVRVDEAAYGTPAPLDRDAGLALYRVAQEALTNAMRHGDRDEPIGFELDWGERQVVLVVTNAVPSAAVAASERVGQGLVGMRERAADAGGDCSAGVGTNGRFRVRVVLPIAAPPQEPEVQPAADPIGALFGRIGSEAHG